MKVTLMLADSAQAVEGKLYILGGGWSVTGPGADADGDRDEAGGAVGRDEPPPRLAARAARQRRRAGAGGVGRGGPAIEIGGEFEVGRPAGVKPGTPIDLPLAINLSALRSSPTAATSGSSGSTAARTRTGRRVHDAARPS